MIGDGNNSNASDRAVSANNSSGAKRKKGGDFEVQKVPVQLDKIKDQQGFSPVDWVYSDDQKFDVVARYNYNHSDGNTDDDTDSHRALLLQGHVDVVPANESDGWSNPPFSPIIRVEGSMEGDQET